MPIAIIHRFVDHATATRGGFVKLLRRVQVATAGMRFPATEPAVEHRATG